jgi:hypothetical protein
VRVQLSHFEQAGFNLEDDLASMSEKGLDGWRRDLAALDAEVAEEIKMTVQEHYRAFIAASQVSACLTAVVESTGAVCARLMDSPQLPAPHCVAKSTSPPIDLSAALLSHGTCRSVHAPGHHQAGGRDAAAAEPAVANGVGGQHTEVHLELQDAQVHAHAHARQENNQISNKQAGNVLLCVAGGPAASRKRQTHSS